MNGYYLTYSCGGAYGYTSDTAPHFNPAENAVLFTTKREARKALKPILKGLTRLAAKRFRIIEANKADYLKNLQQS